jgi:hypothetical protein
MVRLDDLSDKPGRAHREQIGCKGFDMITILVLIAWLTDGAPLPNFFILPPGHPCNNEVAIEYTRRFVAPNLSEGARIQSPEATMIYACLPVPPGPGPGPAMKRVLLDGQNEA